MKKGYTEIAVVLDRSGSMSGIKQDTIGGFNEFLKVQKEAEGEASITLTQFDTIYEVVYSGINVKEAPELTSKSYEPRGCTALLDAIGQTINSVGQRLSDAKEEDRPEKVVFVIITDGEENSSREFTRDQVFKMIEEQTNTWKWEFVFIGANQDSIQAGASLSVGASNSFNFVPDSGGIKAAYLAVASNTVKYRGGVAESMAFTKDQRDEQDEIAKGNVTLTK